MEKYKILVVDDEYDENEVSYNLLFKDDRFEQTPVKTRPEFERVRFAEYDAVILDVNLNYWNLFLSEALNLIKEKCPIMLASFVWESDVTATRVRESVSSVKDVKIIQTMNLSLLDGEYADENAKMLQIGMWIALAGERRKSSLAKVDDEDIEILFISDCQYGDPKQDAWASYIERVIPNFLREKQRQIDLLVITGDIAYEGSTANYNIAESKISELLRLIWPNKEETDRKERLLIVPGNHDVDFRIAATNHISTKFCEEGIAVDCKKMSENDVINSRIPSNYKMQPFRDFCYRLTDDSRWLSSPDLCWINESFLHIGLRFFMLNSAHDIDCMNPSFADIPESATDREFVERSEPSIFNIALSHHGPKDPVEPDSVERFNSWPRISSYLSSNRIHLLMHGHAHNRYTCVTNFETEESISPTSSDRVLRIRPNEFGRVMAPTTHLERELRPLDERGFMILTLRRTNGQVDDVIVDSYETANQTPKPSAIYPITLNYR